MRPRILNKYEHPYPPYFDLDERLRTLEHKVAILQIKVEQLEEDSDTAGEDY